MKILTLFRRLLILCLFAGTATAQWNPDSTVRNQLSSVGYFGDINMINDVNSGVFVTWLNGTGNGNASIMGQRIDSQGYHLWQANGKTIAPLAVGGYQIDHYLFPDDSLGGLIVWARDQKKICAQRFNANGDTLFTPHKTLISLGTGYYILSLKAYSDGNGGVILFWLEDHFTGGKIKELRMDSDGNLLWPSPKTVMDLYDVQLFAGVAPDENNGAFLFFQPLQSGVSLIVTHVDQNGNNTWPAPIVVTTASNGAYDYEFTAVNDSAGNGCYFVYRSAVSSYLQFIDTAGNFRWTNGQLLIDNAISPNTFFSAPLILPDNNGGIFFSYALFGYPDTSQLVYVLRHLDQNGSDFWQSNDTTVITMNNSSKKHSTHPQQSMWKDGSGGIVFNWEEYRNNKLCIYNQHIDSNGNKTWIASGVPVITANNTWVTSGCQPYCNQLYHKSLLISDSTVVIAWEDNRANTLYKQVYAAKPEAILATGIDNAHYGNINIYPNPVQEKIFIELQGNYSVRIYNVFGVKMLNAELSHSAELDVHSFLPGIYFIELNDGISKKTGKLIKE